MVAFGTVVYSNALPYLAEFIVSIKSQTYKDFSFIIINDDILDDELQRQLIDLKIENYIIIDNINRESPVELRIRLLREAKERGYDLIIIGDCDDKFDSQRVKSIVRAYRSNQERTFYYNDLLLFNHNKIMDTLPDVTDNVGNIMEFNYLGLSNTAINLKRISMSFIESLRECDTFVFDWYLFSRILLNGGSGIFVPDTYSLYRIYNNNYAGLNNPSKDKIMKEYNVKIKHYNLLEKYDDLFKILLKKYCEFDVNTYIPDKSNIGFWWSNIKLLE